jgi:ABC-2 type transport system permease protein/lipopolysaccharide transport system permease protein
LTERGLRSRYKQTYLGLLWAIVTPVLLMVVFTVFLKRAAKFEAPAGVPYVLYSYVGILAWTFFAGSVASSSTVILMNVPLINKVYCPREVFPISQVAITAVDTCCALLALFVLFAVNTFAPTAGVVWVPLLTLILVVFTMGASLLAASLTVVIRDLRYGLPIIIQLGIFATPVAYPFDEIPKSWHPAYSAINPLGPLIDSYRETVLQGNAPNGGLLVIAAISSCVYFLLGYTFFKRLEPVFSDIA